MLRSELLGNFVHCLLNECQKRRVEKRRLRNEKNCLLLVWNENIHVENLSAIHFCELLFNDLWGFAVSRSLDKILSELKPNITSHKESGRSQYF